MFYMPSETRRCQNCHLEFTIEHDDFAFYQKINVPPPTWCPTCRNMRRMAWREERSLYRDTCKLCEKPIISSYAPGGPFTVYCRDCWKSDKWDPMTYGRDYDFNQPFFLQYRRLMEAVPRPALTGFNLVNSEFTHASVGCKNCYFLFWSYFSENSQYGYALLLSKDTYDSYVADNSDHAYQALHSNRLYKVRFGYFSDECLDSALLFNCLGCSDCFGCVNLRKQKYCIFNEKLSKDEYKSRMAYWDLGSHARLREAMEKFKELYLSVPHRYAHILNSQNATGDIIRDTKDCHVCFSALDGVQNCKYLYFGGLNLKDSYDVSGGGDTSELLYEIFGVTGNAQRCFFSAGGSNSHDTIYCDWANASSDIFGCIALKHKRYCILNKQYAKEDYEALAAKIRRHMDEMPYMDKRGRKYAFGEFFPTEISAFAYNETFGFLFYPKTKDEVLAEGWQWREPHARSYEITIKPENLPDHVRDAPDSITKEIIGCLHEGTCNEQCTTAFRITPEELSFYREMRIALPRLCPGCRNAQLLKWRNGLHLYRRRCQCGGGTGNQQLATDNYANVARHFHGESLCPNEFETTFPPDSPRFAGETGKLEIVYCDQCYKAEFL